MFKACKPLGITKKLPEKIEKIFGPDAKPVC